MYHQSNLGIFAGHVSQYSDFCGYVPEAGDHHSKMVWDAIKPNGTSEWTCDTWQEHVECAVRATVIAENAVAKWRKQNV